MHHHRHFAARQPLVGWFAVFGGHRGRGADRHGHGIMGGRGSRGGVPGGRRLGSDQLQLVLLALLADKPAHGYELIKALEDRSNGFYRPSPGMIYPALTYLEEIGWATVAVDGTKKLYSLAEPGSRHLAEHRVEADAILAELQAIGARMEQVRRAFAGEPEEDEDSGESDELSQARRELRRVLRDRRHGTPDEARRIAAILRRAVAEITGG